MSRSNPSGNSSNPAECNFEWDGANGGVRYWDKTREETIDVGDRFTFIALDQVGTVKGFSKRHGNIYANEVKDTKAQPLIVRWKKGEEGGEICSGVWQTIKDTVIARGGKFATNLYIAFKQGEKLKIGRIQFKGASLNTWIDFQKKNRGDIFTKAIKIEGSTDHNSGGADGVDYKCPIFKIVDLSPETNDEAVELDKVLQEHFKAYFSRPSTERAHAPTEQVPKGRQAANAPAGEPLAGDGPPESDDVPF